MTPFPRLLRALLLFVLILGGPAGVRAEAPWLDIEAPPGWAGTVKRLEAVDPEEVRAVLRLVGLAEPGPPVRVIVAPEGSGPATLVSPWISGYSLSDQGLIVVIPQRVADSPARGLEDLLRHELAHVYISRAAGHRPLPRWFHEGLALIAGGSWGLDERSRLTLAMVIDRPTSLSEVEQHFLGGESEVHRAYAVAGAFVRDVFDHYGPEATPRILAGVARGLSFEEAFRQATGVTLAQAESAFWSRQTFWNRWVPVLTSSVTLWIGITLLALWAMHHRRHRDEEQRRLWDLEDERARLLVDASPVPSPSGEEWVN